MTIPPLSSLDRVKYNGQPGFIQHMDYSKKGQNMLQIPSWPHQRH